MSQLGPGVRERGGVATRLVIVLAGARVYIVDGDADHLPDELLDGVKFD